ncbi:uncharacterized protein NECHADRAFT_79427 [Fusarium vanettenii 77-13-4]|uniref:Isopropylmalate dehydrogenase-like domain-containing protein n=1 Tax=Fusarium vanettenii (strain ATCC MYA-4622 / CBS 123669 / FGSC 9596 / NRRL 45880 / 77-13-4) TaxID=660122 RepID=C7YNU4_FUSV7|nr:uncharacterized protein NECHADRAFT_79427 [Fusarium vanettenii 77-13-4]EEU46634.1 hypothetical protein NECHADRAFT_79427 [Fusarium vanettenii 77-13-4]
MTENNIVVLAGDYCGPEVRPSPPRPSSSAPSAVRDGAPATSRPERGLLKLRKEMGTYGSMRPCFFASDSLVAPQGRGVPRHRLCHCARAHRRYLLWRAQTGSGSAWNTEPYSHAEVERFTHLAGFLTRGRGDKKLWSLDNANVLATSRFWRKVMTETFEKEFPDLKVEHQLINSAVMIMVKNPTGLNGVVVTSTLFGDIISDAARVIPDSIGLLPSASLSGIPDGNRKSNDIYEPIHVLPLVSRARASSTPSARSCPWPCFSDTLSTSLRRLWVPPWSLRTKELGGGANTKELGEAVINEVIWIPKA